MTNKIIERFKEKEEIYKALSEGKRIMITTNARTAPSSYISEDEVYTLGIEPKDDSYFDRDIKTITDILTEDEKELLLEYTNENGISAGREAYEKTFTLANEQYNYQDIIINNRE